VGDSFETASFCLFIETADHYFIIAQLARVDHPMREEPAWQGKQP